MNSLRHIMKRNLVNKLLYNTNIIEEYNINKYKINQVLSSLSSSLRLIKTNQFGFSTNNSAISQPRQSLLHILEHQVQHQNQNSLNPLPHQNLLSSINWSILPTPQQKSILRLSKQTNTHIFLSYITLKPAVQLSKQKKQQLIMNKRQELQMMKESVKKIKGSEWKKKIGEIQRELSNVEKIYDDDMVQVTIFVRKKVEQLNKNNMNMNNNIKQNVIKTNNNSINNNNNSINNNNNNINNNNNKYLCMQYLSNRYTSQLQSLNFYHSLIPNRIQRLLSSAQYPTRPFHLINNQILSYFISYINNELQLRSEVISTMAELAGYYEQRQYVKWLKNVNEVVG